MSSSKSDTKAVFELLQAVHYPGTEGIDESFLSSVLYQPCDSREHLLWWCLSQISGTTEPTSRDNVELLDQLSSLGLCSANATPLIEGTAPTGQQTKFLKLLLGVVRTVRNLRMSEDMVEKTDDLLHSLCNNKSLRKVIKTEGTSVLPPDLQEMYRVWSKQNSAHHLTALSDTVQSTEQKLTSFRDMRADNQQYPLTIPSEDAYHSLGERMSGSIERVGESGNLFGEMFTSHIKSWMNPDEMAPLPLSNNSISDTYSSLSAFSEFLEASEKLSDMSDRLNTMNSDVEKLSNNPPAVCTVVQRLSEQLTKS